MFQVISHALTSEEEVQYRDEPSSLLDAGAVRKMAIDNVSINYKKENLFNKKKAHAMLFPPLYFRIPILIILKHLQYHLWVQQVPCGVVSLYLLWVDI